MDRNNENDYTKATSDYEPNFILKETAEEKPAIDAAIRPEEKPAVDKAIRSEEKPTVDKAIRPEEKPAVDKAVRPEEKPAVDKAIKPEEKSAPFNIGQSGPQAKETQILRGDVLSGKRPERSSRPETDTSRKNDDGIGAGSTASSRPTFENPSYDDGISGSNRFRDPRNSFKRSGSASWQSGEEDVREGVRAGKRRSKPVTMSRKALAFLIVGCLLLSSIFGFGGAIVGYNMLDSYHQETAQTQATSTNSAAKTETAGYSLQSATGSNMSVKEVTASAKNSVVEIRTEGVTSDSWMQEYVTEGAGSGVIISKDGYIMTNNHVIAGANKIKVTTADEKEYDATLVGADENNDVAILKVDATDLSAATYGNSDELEVGDLAVAIGNPLGELGGTVTAGIISAKDRAISIDGKTLHLLQTDSSINPGNSGGGLFNDSGQLIGLVVAKSAGSDVEGLGFAIPINTAANVAQQLMDKGYVSGQPSTGMTYQEGSAGGGGFGSFDSMFGGQSSTQVYIYSVNGVNAKKAGFKAGDIVLAVDDEEITSFDDLSAIITSHKVGDEVTFRIERDGSEKEIKLELEEKQVSQESASESGNGSDSKDSAPSDEEGEFSPFPEDEGGSLFDYFFGR